MLTMNLSYQYSNWLPGIARNHLHSDRVQYGQQFMEKIQQSHAVRCEVRSNIYLLPKRIVL